ncbi:MAG: M20/M25/M40 family metallo-hydrolase [Nitrospirales bacterium]|nr:M20/M25/M40 family metallo-hydrolase [Nitrospira sp.]MDR4500784.1 M20/M25/M40 family metallo-hydrolase [Nitrospirales bacterium]
MQKHDPHLESYIKHSRPSYEDLLAQMVEIPSVSSDPAHQSDMRHMGTTASNILKSFGAEARLVKTSGYPAVSGGWFVGNHYPTVTIYNHLDVQPADEPEWRHPPFAFHKESDRYHGRGTTDDKGPALTALFAARYAIEEKLHLNIRFLWELEEEIGSPHFGEVLRQQELVPRSDSVLVSDTIWVSKQRPAIPYGLRGLLSARLVLQTGSTDVHSGLTGGGARNPLAELCDIAHACVDAKSGHVKIPGFYDKVVEPTPEESKEFVASGFQVTRFKQAYRLRSLRTDDRTELLNRIWAAPTFEIHGLSGGYIGPGVKTVVPASGELKVSMRLVPNQRPDKVLTLLRRYVKGLNPNVRVYSDGKLEPFRGPSTGPYADALRRSVQVGFGKTPVMVREGGSIGAIDHLDRAWNVPILFMGLSLPEHGYHAPNEYFDWGQASGGIRTFVQYFRELARMGRQAAMKKKPKRSAR